MPGSDGRKMFIASADTPAIRISVAICGGVLRSRNLAGVRLVISQV